jgi:hypothetical protein
MFTGRVFKLCQPIEETVAFLSKPFSKEFSMKVLFTVAETVTSLKKFKIKTLNLNMSRIISDSLLAHSNLV